MTRSDMEAALLAAEALADAVQDLPDGPYHSLYAALAAYRAALSTGEKP